MGTTTPKALIESKMAEDLLTMQYTAVNCKAAIDKLTATNITAGNVTMIVYLVPNGGTPDTSNKLPTVNIAAGKSWPFPDAIGHILESGDAIWTDPGAATSINIRASGREIVS
ncbi:MAG: hypothetical protein V4641_31280 [Pseudomonadota bacterium]